VTDLRPVGGHAGLTLGFDLQWTPEGRSVRNEALILRLAPPGVRAAGPADVVRQARLLRCLSSLGVPVPRVRWFGSDTRYFGTPFHVVERVGGRTFGLDEPDGTRGMGDVRKVGREAIRRLAELHRLDPAHAESVLGEPLDLEADIARWDRFVERAGDPRLVVDVPDLRSKLCACIPRAPRIGILHGDYQWSNLLVGDGQIAAMLDWELAAVGPVLTDLGWLCLFSDPDCWTPPIMLPPLPAPRELVAEYARQSGDDVDEIDWYRAHAAYKFGIIAALNLGLHLRGKRHDPFWEELAPSVPRMIRHGIGLLSA
jgi:aminoglycoside phosphotransferase (APT) family kinase protein